MTDAEFLQQIEARTLPKEEFTHRNHVRLAWLYLNDPNELDPGARIAETIQRYAASLGATQKYSQALTMAWMGLVEAAIAATPAESFDALVMAHPELLDRSGAT